MSFRTTELLSQRSPVSKADPPTQSLSQHGLPWQPTAKHSFGERNPPALGGCKSSRAPLGHCGFPQAGARPSRGVSGPAWGRRGSQGEIHNTLHPELHCHDMCIDLRKMKNKNITSWKREKSPKGSQTRLLSWQAAEGTGLCLCSTLPAAAQEAQDSCPGAQVPASQHGLRGGSRSRVPVGGEEFEERWSLRLPGGANEVHQGGLLAGRAPSWKPRCM